MGSAWQVIKIHQERILQMCNRWNQGGDEQEQSVHQWMCVQRWNAVVVLLCYFWVCQS